MNYFHLVSSIMSQPDSLSSVDSITFAVPTAIIVFFLSFMIFQWEYRWPYFRIGLYLGIPVIVYLLTSVITLLAQYSGCGTVRAGDVFLYSIPSAVFSWMALFLSYFSWCRIPIASVIAPLFSQPVAGQTLEAIELQAPMVKGFSYGFYLFFSTIFGMLVSIGFSSMC